MIDVTRSSTVGRRKMVRTSDDVDLVANVEGMLGCGQNALSTPRSNLIGSDADANNNRPGGASSQYIQ